MESSDLRFLIVGGDLSELLNNYVLSGRMVIVTGNTNVLHAFAYRLHGRRRSRIGLVALGQDLHPERSQIGATGWAVVGLLGERLSQEATNNLPMIHQHRGEVGAHLREKPRRQSHEGLTAGQ